MKEISKKDLSQASKDIGSLREHLQTVIVGQERLMKNLLVSLFARGHMLVEGVPGLAKTLAIESLAACIGGKVSRIQFTPDLLPSDVIGTQIWNQGKGEFETHKGPIFSQFVIADEINRAPAKVQSALLEAMAEKQVTLGEVSYSLASPFVVMATQNPVEHDGTYDLPQAQLDRFLLKTTLTYPTPEEEILIMKRFASGQQDVSCKEVLSGDRVKQIQGLVDHVHVSEAIYEYVKNIVVATRQPEIAGCDRLAGYIMYGASPRASLALIKAAKVLAVLQERTFVAPEDIQEIAVDVLQHRIVLGYTAAHAGITPQVCVEEILQQISVV